VTFVVVWGSDGPGVTHCSRSNVLAAFACHELGRDIEAWRSDGGVGGEPHYHVRGRPDQ